MQLPALIQKIQEADTIIIQYMCASVNNNHSVLSRIKAFAYFVLNKPSLLASAPENHSAPPDVTGYSSDSSHSHTERHHMSNMGTIARNTQKYGNAERMETGDGKAVRCARGLPLPRPLPPPPAPV